VEHAHHLFFELGGRKAHICLYFICASLSIIIIVPNPNPSTRGYTQALFLFVPSTRIDVSNRIIKFFDPSREKGARTSKSPRVGDAFDEGALIDPSRDGTEGSETMPVSVEASISMRVTVFSVVNTVAITVETALIGFAIVLDSISGCQNSKSKERFPNSFCQARSEGV